MRKCYAIGRYSTGALLVILMLLSAPGCGSGGAGSGGFYVAFTFDGTDYTLTQGFTSYTSLDAGANGSLDSGSAIEIGATGAAVTIANGHEGPLIYLKIRGTAPGTYTLDGTAVDEGIFGFTPDGSSFYDDTGNDEMVLTLTAVASGIGDVYSGTFSGTVYRNSDDTPATVTNGVFRVERVADDSIVSPFM